MLLGTEMKGLMARNKNIIPEFPLLINLSSDHLHAIGVH